MPSLSLNVPDETLRELVRNVVQEVLSTVDGGQSMDIPLALTEREAAERVGLTADQLRNERRLGRITFRRLCGKRVRYTMEDLSQYLEKHQA